MHGIPGAFEVLAALLHGVCTLHTSSKESARVRVEGAFPVDNIDVQASTAAFLAAMEPRPMWNGPLPVCLVEHHLGSFRRLRLVLASQTLLYPVERLLLSREHRVHGSGLLLGYAADRRAEPDWLVVPDGAQPHAWRLLHAASKGGMRFSVGHSSRYPPGQAEDAASKANEYQFEALHKIYFYDAWRSQPELGTKDSFPHLPPCPGLLEAGCISETTVTEIREFTFAHCVLLQSVMLPYSLHTIHSKAFMNCAALQELAIPPSLHYIACKAVLDCTVLRRLARMPGQRKTWRGTRAEETAFALCPRWRLPQWLHLIPDLGYVTDLA